MSNVENGKIQLPNGKTLTRDEWAELLKQEEAQMNRLNRESIERYERENRQS